jgi:peptide/nickel transport system permease protein
MESAGRLRFVIRKLIRYILILFVIITINFIIPHLMPGDPVMNMIGPDVLDLNDIDLDRIYTRYGLDKSLPEQYTIYLRDIIRFDLKKSIVKNQEVSILLRNHLRWTLMLVLPATVLAGSLALFLGTLAGYRAGSRLERILTVMMLIVYAAPTFLFGLVALFVFAFKIELFPLGHLTSGFLEGFEYFIDLLYHLTLPVLVLGIAGSAYKYIIVKSSLQQLKNEYFIFVMKSRGLGRKRIMFRHLLRNVLPQFISVMAISFGFMVGGSLLVEIVFSLGGMGSLIHEAVLTRDYPVLQGSFLVLTLCVLFGNFVADILYGVADPRIAGALIESNKGRA